MKIKKSLSVQIIGLIIFIIITSFLIACILFLKITDNIIAQRLNEGSKYLSTSIAKDPGIKLFLENPQNGDKGITQNLIDAVSKTNIASIIIVDKNNHVFVQNTSFSKDPAGTLQKALVLAERGIPYIPDDQLDMKNFFSSLYAEKIYNDENEVIGTVIVGDHPSILEKTLIYEVLFSIVFSNALGLIVGIMAAMILAREIKSILFGFEPEEIAKILQERIAMLNSVQEGILSIDKFGNIILVNTSAKNILQKINFKNNNPLGEKIEIIYGNDLMDVLQNGKTHLNKLERINNVPVITNQVPIIIAENIQGAITTFKLKTELEQMAEELTGIKNYSEVLRAQTHEFMNKMHVILGLVNMKDYKELHRYVKNIVTVSSDESRYIGSRIKNSLLSAFISGKVSRAKELDIDFQLTDESYIPEFFSYKLNNKLITIIGNLLNNAFESLLFHTKERIVLLTIVLLEDDIFIIVEDSGPGMSKDTIDKLFEKGFSTKGHNRGIGLNLVKETIADLNGTIEVDSSLNVGTTFTVKIPFKGDISDD